MPRKRKAKRPRGSRKPGSTYRRDGKTIGVLHATAPASGKAMRRAAAEGGTTSGTNKKEKAAVWRKNIRPEVERLLTTGMSNTNIARRTHATAGCSEDTVSRFVAEVRRAAQAGPSLEIEDGHDALPVRHQQ